MDPVPLTGGWQGKKQGEIKMADDQRARSGALFGLGLLTGVAATVAVLATRMRVYHYGACPECNTDLVVSYEPSDDEPCIRRQDAVEHPAGSRLEQVVRRAREHPQRPCRTVVVIG
jgi:hypothetical protein